MVEIEERTKTAEEKVEKATLDKLSSKLQKNLASVYKEETRECEQRKAFLNKYIIVYR